jgi:hypothetical protein
MICRQRQLRDNSVNQQSAALTWTRVQLPRSGKSRAPGAVGSSRTVNHMSSKQ